MKRLIVLAAMVIALFSLFACAPVTPGATLVSMTYVSGIDSEYTVGSDIDLTKVVVMVRYSDGKDVLVNSDKLTFSEVSTAKAGNYTMTITFETVHTEVVIKVVEEEAPFVITEVSQPDFVLQYNSNIAEQENKEEEFFFRNDNYYVGSDNAFRYNLKVMYYNGTTVKTLETYTNVSKISILNDDTYVDLEGAELAKYVTVDEALHTYLFTEEANGRSFRLRVYPKEIPESQADKIPSYTKTFDFAVIEGYNCYTAKDLYYLDNYEQAWMNYRLNLGLEESKDIRAIIFHSDIEVTVDDIPSAFLYNVGDADVNATDSDYDRVIGSMRDNPGAQIYRKQVNGVNDDFSFIGNYFSWDISALPLVVRESGEITEVGAVISHATLFRIYGNETEQNKGTAEMRNISLIGNSPRSENATLSGGLIFTKTEDIDVNFENMITRCWFIVYMPQINDQGNAINISYTKNYDSFNCFIYVWGHDNVNVDSSIFSGSGGPIVIADHVDPTKADNYVSGVSFINCVLDSWVAGTEGWFNLVGASAIVPQLKAMNALFTPFGASFLKTDEVEKMNFVAIVKSGSAQSLTTDDIKGKVQINGSTPLDFGASDQVLAAYLGAMKAYGAPVFQSSAGGIAYTDGATGLYELNLMTGASTQIIDPTHAVFDGGYLNMYINMGANTGYMGVVLGYQN
ncbi:MAG: bacterial Ig-like domain-containing protein [Clostridia bacterium]|nr:bacterial Ig-like domain-containing protein [Clostridia bacterium]